MFISIFLRTNVSCSCPFHQYPPHASSSLQRAYLFERTKCFRSGGMTPHDEANETWILIHYSFCCWETYFPRATLHGNPVEDI